MGVPSRREMPGTGRVGCTTDRFWCSSPSPAVRAGRAEALRSQDATSRRGHVDRKSTRLNSSHEWTSYAVFCVKKQKLVSIPPLPIQDYLTYGGLQDDDDGV